MAVPSHDTIELVQTNTPGLLNTYIHTTISFVLPSEYTLETLPMPNNPQVTITQVDARKVAVLSFTWYPTAKRVENKKKELLTLIENDGLEVDGEIQVARYNPPLSMPLMLRSEIIIPIK